MNDDSGWIPLAAAMAWLVSTYRLSVGAAEKALDDAVAEGTVRRTLIAAEITEPCPAYPYGRAELVDPGVRERLNFGDLRWQIERQLGTPRADHPEGASTPQPRRPGPQPGKLARFAEADFALSPKVARLMKEERKSQYAACLKLAEAGEVEGTGSPESRAKRLMKSLKLTETR